jgi:hypothetical protein
MQDRHREFLKKIRLPKESAQKKEDSRKVRSNGTHKMTEQEQNNLQRELEVKFDELFGGLKDEED